MIVSGSARHAEKRRRVVDVDGVGFHKSEWLESGQDPLLSPTVFLVEQPPNTRLKPHFHGENQFQVFVQGSGSIGRDAILPVTVHYAGAYTGYGPLLSGPDGIFYFTIRAVFETGTKTGMEQMVRGPKRHCVSSPSAPVEAQALRTLTSVERIELIELQPDGVAASILRIPPGAEAHGIAPATGGGQFYMVMGGELHHGATTLGRWETMFASRDEPAVALSAGASGLEVLCLQLAPKDPAYATRTQAPAVSAAN
jgi:hypothetical protein